jgi:hypothetical protein
VAAPIALRRAEEEGGDVLFVLEVAGLQSAIAASGASNQTRWSRTTSESAQLVVLDHFHEEVNPFSAHKLGP